MNQTRISVAVARLFLGGVAVGASLPSLAANCVWNPATGNWGTASNWSCGIVPSGPNADSATIGAGKAVTVNAAQSILTLGNAGTINIDAFLLTLQGGGSTTNSGTINVGGPSTAALQMSQNIDNTGGVINVGNGSVLNQFSGTITGGTINTTGTGAVVAQSNGSNVLSGVTLNGTLDVATPVNGRERIANGLTLNGVVNVANGGVLNLDSTLTAGGNQTIGGNATINLNDPGARLAIEGNGTTTLASTVVVRGQGNVGQALIATGNNTLVNNGRISADVATGTLSLVNPGNIGAVTNNGVLDARSGGTLSISTNVTNGPSGQINAQNASRVVLNGASVTGGTLGTTGTGVIQSASNGSNVLSGTTIAGTLDMTSVANARQRLVNTNTLTGAVNVANGGILSLDASPSTGNAVVLNGTGTINLNDAGARLAVEGTGTTTIGAGITVRGQGNFGQALIATGTNTLTNNGLVSADVAGGTLNIVPPANAGGSQFINNGTLQAVNGGTLLLSSNITANPGGQIIAGAGSQVVQNGVRINGVINASGSGVFTSASTSSNVLDGVTFTGNLDLASVVNARNRIANGATINGNVNIANGGILSLDSTLTSGGNQTIGGTATINLNDAGARLAFEGNGTTTIGAGITVRGQGNVGAALLTTGNNQLLNNGVISADVAGGTLALVNPGNLGSVTNNGALQAINGGKLLLSTDVVGNAGSQIVAGAGSQVVQNGVRISGIVNTSGSGVFTSASSGSNFLDAVTLNGNLDVATITNGRNRIVNGATINGAVTVANGGILSLDSTQTAGGNQTIAGNATINMNDAGARLAFEGNGTTTLASTVVVRGQGNVGQALLTTGINSLVNNGRISADVSGGTLSLVNPGNLGSVTNNGVLDARSGGTLSIQSNVSQGAGGQINAQTGSAVVLAGTTITGGTLGTTGSGVIQSTSSGANVLNGTTIAGTLDMTGVANSRQRLINTTTLNGVANVGNGGVLSLDSSASTGNAVLVNGTGTINLNDAGARLSIEGSGTTTIGAGVTVRGQGNIGQPIATGGNNTLSNNGTILADGGVLTISSPAGGGSSSLVGTGTLQANGGTLNVATGNASQQGRLLIGAAAGSQVNLNNQNITIGTDYVNDNSGTGNAFNRRANVVGTGQILAGGNAQQVITGANVTGGNTTNATLTIGNVHVGTNTFNYQVTNAGTTGPTLRGAIQTSVNGGNITDARLSGTGVTAANYNAGGPGGSTGNLAVNFNVATAGAIAPLSGQAINLASNFDNIANQKLTIVAGAGAAAYNLAAGNTTPATVVIANQRVNGTTTAALNVANTAPSGSFTEDLNAVVSAVTGAVTGSGSALNVLAGASAGGINVGLATGSSGAKSGTVNIAYTSTGAVNGVSNGLGTTAVGSQVVNVSGNVYQAAAGQLQGNALNFGTLQVGQSVSQNLVVRNTATGAAGFVEDLNASLGASGNSQISGAGALSGIRAGNNSTAANGTMTVTVNATTAGALASGIAVNYATAGAVNGVSNGLGVLGVGSEQFNVNGTISAVANVINQASPQINNQTINLGNVRQGAASPTANVSVTNVATVAPQAALNATITGNAPVTASGSFGLLGPGATNNSALSVGISTANAGAVSGTATVGFVSDASNVGNCAPNCQLTLASQNVNVNANVYRVASPQLNTPTVNLVARVGDVAPTGNVSITNASPDQFTEALRVTAGAAPAGFSVGANPANIAAGASGTLQVGASTATAGSATGNLTLTNVSTGAGTTNAADLTLGTSNVTLNSRVYQAAQGNVQSAINFGIVHVGDIVGVQGVSVSNSAPSVALNDTLRASISGGGGAFSTNGGSVSGLLAGGPGNATAMTVGLNTATAGVFSGTANVALVSQNPDMADLSLGSRNVALSATVNNYANAAFTRTSGAGALSQSGSQFILDFGSVAAGSGVLSSIVDVRNLVSGPADFLNGSLTVNDGNDFASALLQQTFANVGAGGSSGNLLSFLFDTSALGSGSFQDLITLSWFGTNANYTGAASTYTLLVRGSVFDGSGGGQVPAPASLLLVFVAGLGYLCVGRGGRRARG